jgi:hypothetical protein
MVLQDSQLNCMTHCQALQGFSDKESSTLHKNNKINLPILQELRSDSHVKLYQKIYCISSTEMKLHTF